MSRAPVILYLGDIFSILLFAIIGRQSHDMSTGISAFSAVFSTAAPFIIGWFLASPWLGAFQPGSWKSAKSAVLVVLKAIIPALIVSIFVRALFEGGFSPFEFYLVTGSFMLLILVIWRLTSATRCFVNFSPVKCFLAVTAVWPNSQSLSVKSF